MAELPKARKSADQPNLPNSPECGQWETLLVDALDGLLTPEDEATFTAHMAICESCSAMFEQARRGREWLEFLSPEPQVPYGLLDKILADTGHGKMSAGKSGAGRMGAGGLAVAGVPAEGGVMMPPVWQQPGFSASMKRFAEPRLMMTAAMAFFSIALTLSITGVRFTSMKMADLRPSAVRSVVEKRIMTASTPIVRYYDHLRFVYEVESRMRELRRSSDAQEKTQPKSQPSEGGEGESHRKDGGSKLGPNEIPQQTSNPDFASGEPLLALEQEKSVNVTEAFGPSDQVEGSLRKTSVRSALKRSKSCLA